MNKIKGYKFFIILSLLMSAVVIVSNYLVQFPFVFFGFSEILTYGAFSYPVAFLITDLTNRKYGKRIAKYVVYIGFSVGILISIFFSIETINLISLRIALASGAAFLTSQLLDVNIFDKLRNKAWYVPPLTSSLISSTLDTFLFFLIAFYSTGLNWVTLALGDLCVKIFVALFMLLPFRFCMFFFQDISKTSKETKNNF